MTRGKYAARAANRAAAIDNEVISTLRSRVIDLEMEIRNLKRELAIATSADEIRIRTKAKQLAEAEIESVKANCDSEIAQMRAHQKKLAAEILKAMESLKKESASERIKTAAQLLGHLAELSGADTVNFRMDELREIGLTRSEEREFAKQRIRDIRKSSPSVARRSHNPAKHPLTEAWMYRDNPVYTADE